MKIAVTYEDGRIFQHFGHTEQFKIYETADGRIVRAEVVDTNGSGHGGERAAVNIWAMTQMFTAATTTTSTVRAAIPAAATAAADTAAIKRRS